VSSSYPHFSDRNPVPVRHFKGSNQARRFPKEWKLFSSGRGRREAPEEIGKFLVTDSFVASLNARTGDQFLHTV
jgi:hypothetical protein